MNAIKAKLFILRIHFNSGFYCSKNVSSGGSSYLWFYETIRFTFFDDCYIKRCLCKAAVHRAGVKGQDRLAEEKVGG